MGLSLYGLDMNLQAIMRLGIYKCTNYKNRSDVQMCLDANQQILPEEPIMPYNPTPHQRKMLNLRAATIKNEEILKKKLRSLSTVVMSLCDMILEDKVSCHKDFASIKRNRNTISFYR